MVTGKNKKQFEEWFYEFQQLYEYMNINYFLTMKFEFQIGVFLAYYDSTRYKITTNHNDVIGWYFKIKVGKTLKSSGGNFKTRNEAEKEALKETDKLMNK